MPQSIWLAYVANNSSNDLLVSTASTEFDGYSDITWLASAQVNGQSSQTAPALAVVDNTLVLAYVANNSSNDLLVTTSSDGGSTWTASARVSTQSSKTAPALAVLAEGLVNTLVLAYVANNESNDLLVTKSSDKGSTWTAPARVSTQSSKTAPALAVLDNTLVLAYVANNESNDLLVTKSGDGGSTWSASPQVNGQSSQTAPALAAVTVDNRLVLAYVANNSSNDLLWTTSIDGGSTWTASAQINTSEGQSSKTAPALAVLGEEGGGTFVLAYVANNESNDLLYAVGPGWSFSYRVSTQSSKMAPALAVLDN
jgi:hypothetical protein